MERRDIGKIKEVMRGEMRRSMRGAQGHGRLTGAVIRRLTLEQERDPASQMPGYVADDWACVGDPGGRTCDIAITSCL